MKIKTLVNKLNEKALTIQEVSDKCGVSYRNVQRWLSDGKIPYEVIKGNILIDPINIPTYIRLKTFRKTKGDK